ncbi:MAG: hypothetical protein PHV52_00230 [Aliarcobacter sp.]|nr:hypothetical protein [Aliarcobacter sp.]
MEILAVIIVLLILYFYHAQIKELKANFRVIVRAHNEYADIADEEIKKLNDKIEEIEKELEKLKYKD